MLAPLTPHMAEELWERSGEAYSVHQQPFPSWDDDLAAEETITLVVQVNGKVRGRLQAPADIDEGDAKEMALQDPNVRRHVEGLTVAKVVYVPGKLVNIVAR